MPDTLEHTPAKPITSGPHLGPDKVATIRSLAKLGKTQVEIAAILNCSQPTVSKWLHAIEDPIEEAKHIARTAAPKFASRIANGKSEQVALEMLDRLGVTERPASATPGGKGSITVIIGAADTQVQVNVIEHYQTQDPQLGCANDR
jgi:DNA-binding transcriptional regulator YiaG